MKRAALYVRVSTAEQKNHGLSVDSQIEALQTFCQDNGYIIAGIYNDAGISARKKYTKRPALLQLLNDCKADKIDIILFTKLDRWFRSVADYYEVQTILDKKKVPWRSIWEDYETETSSGIFKVNIMLSVAQSEADRTSERIKSVNEYKRARGDYVGTPPTGYKLAKSEMIIDQDLYPAVKEYFSEYIKTRNVVFALKKAKALGLKCSKETAQRMLKNPAYKGDAFGGYQCEAYITEAEWNYIQSVRSIVDKESFEKEFRTYLFGGLVYCAECGKSFSGTVRRMKCGKEKKAYKYYRCRGHQNLYCTNNKSITEMKLEKYVIDNIGPRLDWYKLQAELYPVKQIDNSKKIVQLQSKLKRVGERYEDGDIDRNEYLDKKKKINFEIELLREESAKTQVNAPKSLPADWLSIYCELDDLHKKLFWSSILAKILVDKEGNISLLC